MGSVIDQVLHSLATAGPVALVLGYCLWVLWGRSEKKDLAHAQALVLKDKTHSDQEDAMRLAFETQLAAERTRADQILKAERERHATEEKELRGELVDALHTVASAMRG